MEEDVFEHGSTCSGIGGFDFAAELMGWNNAFHCEFDEKCQRVLKYYWPNAKSYKDLTTTDFTIWRNKIDILTGGIPCQPYSIAGNREGTEDARHLWPDYRRALREIQPGYSVIENVRGLINWNEGMVFHEIKIEMEAEGYEVAPFLLPACSVNAPHERYRIWFVAYSRSNVLARRLERRRNQEATSGSKSENEQPGRWSENGKRFRFELGASGANVREEVVGNSSSAGCEERYLPSKPGLEGHASGGYDEIHGIGNAWGRFPTQFPICLGNDGLSPELVGITFSEWNKFGVKSGGNAIVPELALMIYKAIKEFDKTIV